MSELLPEFAAALPADVQLDGELVAYDADGRPDFHRLSARMLHGDTASLEADERFGTSESPRPARDRDTGSPRLSGARSSEARGAARSRSGHGRFGRG
jgi:hypothetical protein